MFDNPAYRPAPRYREYAYTLTPGEELEIITDADFISCLEATADFDIGIDAPANVNFKQGLRLRVPGGFKSVRINNTSAANNTVSLGIGMGDFVDARLNISGSITNEAQRPDLFTDAAPVAAAAGPATTLIMAANAKRNEAILVNTGTVDLWIKGSNAVSKTGVFLAAGQNVILGTTAALYAYNPDAAAAGEVAASELEFS